MSPDQNMGRDLVPGTSPETALARQQDAESRALALTEFVRPVVLEAGAGTGKTTTLVGRIVCWLVRGGFERAEAELARPGAALDPARVAARALRGVVAITFTDAAAAEMDSRLRSALRALAAGTLPTGIGAGHVPPLGLRAERAHHLALALEAPLARTIHGYCAELLRTHPLEAGLDPLFVIDAEERLVAELAREVLEESLARRTDSRWIAAIDAELEPSDVEDALLALHAEGVRAEDLDASVFSPQVASAALTRLATAIETFLDSNADPCARLAHGSRTAKAKEVLGVLKSARLALTNGSVNSLAELDALLRALHQGFTASIAARLLDWSRGKFTGAEATALHDDLASFRQRTTMLLAELESLRRHEPLQFEPTRSLVRDLLASLRERLVRQGIQGYSDLVRDARDLVERVPSVARALRAELDQLLVDEFQDTDPEQCALVRALALEPRHGRQPGLFLVGDPKQSIYGWRRADLAAYEGFLAEVRARQGFIRSLVVNYRSTFEVLDEVRAVMNTSMQAEAGLQPEFHALFPARDEAHGPPVEHWCAWDLGTDPDSTRAKTPSLTATRIEAAWLARDLVRQHADGTAWRNMAVLLRSTTALETFVEALREAAVPFEVAVDRTYYRRREILDATAWLSTIVDPLDHLALLAVLRSPQVGVPDAALELLWNGTARGRAWRDLISALQAPGGETAELLHAIVDDVACRLPSGVPGLERVVGFECALHVALEALGCLRQSLRQDPGEVFVENLRDALLHEATEAARHLGHHRATNLERFFARVAATLESSEGDAEALLRLVRESIADPRKNEDKRPADPSVDSVSILTFHKAKGLEFEHVYVMDLARNANKRSTKPTSFDRASGACVIAGLSSMSFGAVAWRLARRDELERVRLLYVAMTRAAQRLVLSGRRSEDLRTAPLRARSSLMALIGPSRSERIGPALATAIDAGLREVRDEKVLYRLPAPELEIRAANPPRAGGESPLVPGEASTADELERAAAWARRAREDEARLALARREADACMARRWTRALGTHRDSADVRDIEAPTLSAADAWEAREDLEPRTAGVLAHRTDRRTLAAPVRSVEPADDRSHSTADHARAVGETLHRALEGLGRARSLDDIVEHTRWSEIAREFAPDADAAATLGQEARAVVARHGNGVLARRLLEFEPGSIACETPILVAAHEVDDMACVLSGTIDLLAFERDGGGLVIVDHKSDRVTPGEAPERASQYAGQMRAYVCAVQRALRLDVPPRAELWFWRADERVVIDVN